METMLLRVYQRHIVHCCQAVLFGAEELRGDPYNERGRLWYSLQNLIIGAGNLSKTLWGTGRNEEERTRRYAERQRLRDTVFVTDLSVLRNVKIRNHYEHLDERIEIWWNTSKHRNIIQEIIGPRNMVGGAALGQRDILRWFDPTSGDVIFWGSELNVPAVVVEVERILPIARDESGKPHWDDPRDVHRSTGGDGT